jgi:(p)ppGpp synthase/HD superfamily hydrolase
MSVINHAYAIAEEAHRGICRKGSSMPYIIHPLRVADHIGLDDTITACALLHDVLEDCDIDYYDLYKTRIKELDDGKILSIVEELTKDQFTDKEEYLQSFAIKSIESLIIKIYDRYDNVKEFSKENNKYATKYAAKANILYMLMKSRCREITSYGGRKFFLKTYDIVTELETIANTLHD